MTGCRPPRPGPEKHKRRHGEHRGDRDGQERAPARRHVARPARNRQDAKDPVRRQIPWHGKGEPGGHHGTPHHHDARDQQRQARLVPGAGGRGVGQLPAARALQEDDGEREPDAPVEREDDAVLCAAQQRPDAELHDRCLRCVAEGRQPAQPGYGRRDVRLLRDLPKRAEVRQRAGDRGSSGDQRQARPGTARQGRESRCSAELLKQAEEPVRGGRRKQPPLLRCHDGLRPHQHRLKKVRADNEAEGAQLQKRRDAQEMAAGKQRCCDALRAHGQAEDEHPGRGHGEPVGGRHADPCENATGASRSRVQCQRPHRSGHHVKHNDGEARAGGHGGELRQQNRVGVNRQRREHEDVTVPRERGIPGQHREDPHDQHGCRNQEMLDVQGEQQACLGRRRAVDRQGGNRETDAHEDQQRGELEQQLARVALRMARQQISIDDAKEELAVEHAKLLPHHAWMRSAI